MRTNRTFSVELSTIQQLKREVTAGYRSAFVNDAIKFRLTQKGEYSIIDIPARNRAASLLPLEDVPDHIKILIREWLTEVKE
jgi:hypothetical protein